MSRYGADRTKPRPAWADRGVIPVLALLAASLCANEVA